MAGGTGGLRSVTWLPIVVALVVVGSDLWVYGDAKAHAERGRPVMVSIGSFQVSTPPAWFVGCLILWVVFFPLYIGARN